MVERGRVTARSFWFLFDPAKRKRMIAGWQNPVAVKEFRTRPMLQMHWLGRMTSICLMVSLALMVVVAVVVQARVTEGAALVGQMAAVVAVLQIAALVLVGPAMSAGSLASDRESGVWDLMRTSRLGSWTIVSGKLQAAIVPLILTTAAMIPPLAILPYLAPGLPSGFALSLTERVVRSLCVVGVTMVFVAVAGMFFSSLCSRTGVAAAWTYGVVAAMSLASLLALPAGQTLSYQLRRLIFLPSPVAAVLDAAGMESFQQYNLFAAHLRLVVAVTVVLGALTVLRVWRLRGPDR